METPQADLSQEEIVMKRLRKVGDPAGANWRGQAFEPDADGIITVPHIAVGELVESHGFEEVLDEGGGAGPAPPPVEEPPPEVPSVVEAPPPELPLPEEHPAPEAPPDEVPTPDATSRGRSPRQR